MPSAATRLYRWTRELHLYFGLFVCPYVLIFAVTTILLNHGWRAEVEEESTSVTVDLRGIEESEQVASVVSQLDLSGEVHERRFAAQNRLQVRVERPAGRTIAVVDLATNVAEIKRQRRSFLGTLTYLHFNPGPHKVRGLNWFFSKLWGWSVDAAVCLLLFITISGVYMWTVIKAERKAGWIMLGVGSVSFVLIVAGFFVGA